MHRRARAPHECRRTSEEFRLRESRVSGEIFIERPLVSLMSSAKTICVWCFFWSALTCQRFKSGDKSPHSNFQTNASRLDRKGEGKTTRFYKYFGPTALGIILAASIFPQAAEAQRRAQTASSIPSPRAVLGFNPGDDRTIADWKQISDYFARLDRASDRVEVRNIGTSTLGRTMIAAFISAPENIRSLENYKAIQAKLADPRKAASDAERDQLIREGKTVVVISCSIHSTEIVASQMSMQLAYELATAQDADTLEILDNTILILIPSPNPDGIQLVADWYRASLGHPWEGTEPTEIYHPYAGHDDNRDWFMLNLRETRAFTRLFWKEWFPEVVYDIHQQGQTGSRPLVPPLLSPPTPTTAPL